MRIRPRRQARRCLRDRVFVTLLVVLALVDSATIAGAAVLQARRLDRVNGTNAVVAPVVESAARTGAFSENLEYAALFSADGHRVSSDVAWDDDWFFSDSASYNQDLAHTCSVFTAIANAESSYYQQGSTSPAYAEHAFAQLGFDEVSTASYRYRSEILDEVAGVFDDETDVVAYTVATKRVRSSQTGEERLLTVVAVRGSYGSEWISNARIEGSFTAAGEKDGESDHLGFTEAANEVISDLRERAEADDSGLERVYLVCGHSRGGAVTDLVASYLIDVAGTAHELSPAANVYAYAFATPGVTSSGSARDERYSGIFNMLNPSDLVPQLPLESWGYTRYGVDVWLPGADEAGFTPLYEGMRASYVRSMGCEPTCDPCDRYEVADFVVTLGERADSFEEFISPLGLAQTAWSLLTDVDVARLLASHYPNTYIAWLDATTADDLRFTR